MSREAHVRILWGPGGEIPPGYPAQQQPAPNLRQHGAHVRGAVLLTCRSVDRIFLQAYVPKLSA